MLSGDADADINILSAKFLLICNVGSPTRSSLFFTKTAPASESTKSKSTAEDAEASLQCTGQHRHKFPSLSENLKIFVIKLSRHSNPQRHTPQKRNCSGHHFAPLHSSTCRTLDHKDASRNIICFRATSQSRVFSRTFVGKASMYLALLLA